MPSLLRSFAPLADRYDGFLFDLWGVLYDGRHAFPEAVGALRELKARGKKIGLVSNSPRPALAAQENIATHGLTPDLFDGVFTSGQMVCDAFASAPLKDLGRRCLFIAPPSAIHLYADLHLTAVRDFAHADFVFLTNILADHPDVEDYRPLLEQALAHRLPMVCANPDTVAIRNDVLSIAAGAIAEAYEAMGGTVYNRGFGKPHPEIFQRALGDLALDVSHTIMVGDNLETDIAGGAIAGLNTLWILNGVHRDQIAAEGMESVLRNSPVQPTYALNKVVW